MSAVQVYARDGRRLLNTYNGGKVRHLLKGEMAQILRQKPFSIQLLYDPPGLSCEMPEGKSAQPRFEDRPHSNTFYREKKP